MHIRGFTLAELLIALMILGVIATFTIPKVLLSQQTSTSRAVVKETAAALSGAYQTYTLTEGSSTSMQVEDLIPYLNYIKIITSGELVDSLNTWDYDTCNGVEYTCVKMHSGATVAMPSYLSFGSAGSTNAIWFHIDPDGQYSGLTTGNSKAVSIILFYNGRLTSWGQLSEPIVDGWGDVYSPDPTIEPSYFRW